MRQGWQSRYPSDWCVAQCPLEEMGPLHDYEFSRECGALRAQVDWIRRGIMPEPTFWSPEFGWSEWPENSYLSTPQEERLRRLQLLAATNYDEIRASLARPATITFEVHPKGKEISIYLDANLSPQEQEQAVLALLHTENRGGGRAQPPLRRAQGRASAVARRFNRVRALSAARLLQLYPAAEALRLMNKAHEKPNCKKVFCDASTLRRAARRAHPYLIEFMWRADRQIRLLGLWPPPFGPALVDLEKEA